MFRDRRIFTPVRDRLQIAENKPDNSDIDITDQPYEDVDIDMDKEAKKNLYDMIENWREGVNSEEAKRRMLENYIRAYIDISDEEMNKVLEQHGV